MTDTSRLQFGGVKETTLGTTPTTPRMRRMRILGESLSYAPQSVTSEEIRDDRMTADPILVGLASTGGITWELSYPVQDSLQASIFESAFCSSWSNMPVRDNDGVADSVITDIGTTANTVVVTTGPSYVVGHLVRHTGFAVAGNNGLFPVTTGGATSYVSAGASFTAETAPPAAARSKVVGFQGGTGDITATATGLGSTTLNFTTLGLAVGQWVYVSSEGGNFSFATAACRGFARITAISATALTLDNLPTGWTTDAGTGRTIRVYVGDRLRNGTSEVGLTLERGFLGQTVPSYIAQRGMIVSQLELSLARKQKITCSASFMGMSGGVSTTSLDASFDSAPDSGQFQVFAGSANVARVAEAGAALTAPNWCSSLRVSVNNNARMIEAVDSITAVDIGLGSQDVGLQAETYFGDASLYSKVLAMTPTRVSSALVKNNQAIVLTVPRATPTGGNPNAAGRNQDAMVSLSLQASFDSVTNSQIGMDRLEYYA